MLCTLKAYVIIVHLSGGPSENENENENESENEHEDENESENENEDEYRERTETTWNGPDGETSQGYVWIYTYSSVGHC